MSLDLTTLGMLKTRERYERLAKHVPKRALDTKTGIILADFGRFFKEFEEADTISPEAFSLFFKQIHPTLTDEQLSTYDALFLRVYEEKVSPEVEPGLMRRLMAAATAYDVAAILEKFQAGDEVDLRTEVASKIDEYDKMIDRKIKNPQVLDPIEDLLKEEANDHGFKFRNESLNRHIKPLRAGDFMILAARPDKGKTTWCSDNLTYMASQVDTVYPGENRSILWFNNEGPGKRIITRNFQSALYATMEELVALSNTPATSDPALNHRTMVRQKYAEALGGRPGALRVFDIHDMWNNEVEDLMRLYKPALVLFDMVDNIKFGGEVANNGQRTDQILEAMYQWARLKGVQYDCPIIATSQLPSDADGLQYPTLPQLKDSRTGKQGAAEVILTIGSVNDPVLAGSRWFGCTKNKRTRTGVPMTPMQEVRFDGDRGRFIDM